MINKQTILNRIRRAMNSCNTALKAYEKNPPMNAESVAARDKLKNMYDELYYQHQSLLRE